MSKMSTGMHEVLADLYDSQIIEVKNEPTKSEINNSVENTSSQLNNHWFACVVRAKLLSEDDAVDWMRQFKERTATDWIVRLKAASSDSKFAHYVYNKDFLCHRSSYRKLSKSKKSCGCTASITIRVKKDSTDVKRRDVYSRQGLFGLIKINNRHNHEVNAEDSLRWLRRRDETVAAFYQYFDSGRTPAQAYILHQDLLRTDGTDVLADRSINPPKHWVYTLHEKWLKENEGDDTTTARHNDEDKAKRWVADLKTVLPTDSVEPVLSTCDVAAITSELQSTVTTASKKKTPANDPEARRRKVTATGEKLQNHCTRLLTLFLENSNDVRLGYAMRRLVARLSRIETAKDLKMAAVNCCAHKFRNGARPRVKPVAAPRVKKPKVAKVPGSKAKQRPTQELLPPVSTVSVPMVTTAALPPPPQVTMIPAHPPPTTMVINHPQVYNTQPMQLPPNMYPPTGSQEFDESLNRYVIGSYLQMLA